MKDELSRCPFCDGMAKPDGVMHKCEMWWRIRCIRCNTTTAHYPEIEKAASTWNRRIGRKKR